MNNLITWSCCRDCKEPDWSAYDALELAGVVMRDHGTNGTIVVRVDDETPQFYSLYGHLVEGGCDAIHDFDSSDDIALIRQQCLELAQKLSLDLNDFS